MAPLTGDRKSEWKEGGLYALPAAATAHIFSGALANANAAGFLKPGSDTAGEKFIGVSAVNTDNSGGLDGAEINQGYLKGVLLFDGSGLTAAAVGEPAYVVDDQTVGLGIAAQPVNVTGVAVKRITTSRGGTKALAFTAAGTLLGYGGGAAVNVGAGGDFTLTAPDGAQLLVTVTAGSLPVGNASDNIQLRHVRCGRIAEVLAGGAAFVDIEKLN